jgi:hypothetical protein
MLSKMNPLQIQSTASELYRRCTEEGDMAACNEMHSGQMGEVMKGPQQPPVGFAKPPTTKLADGGEVEEASLLAPDPGMSEIDQLTIEDPFLPIMDVIGEENYMELLQAMGEYPVVARIAEMAMKTSDGYVEGEGGPTDDLVPARLSDGEFVFSAEAVQAIGLDTLEDLHEKGKRMAASS